MIYQKIDTSISKILIFPIFGYFIYIEASLILTTLPLLSVAGVEIPMVFKLEISFFYCFFVFLMFFGFLGLSVESQK